ncbi:MAG: metallophosphatase family protein [Acidobacteriia bacterium]|nr:metallophosphatase family protein [Terriglobia bacterium]
MRIGVISDVHGNRWALEAVMRDLDRRGVAAVLDLGDGVYGPLDPRGTAALLIGRNVESVRGNEDRIVLEPSDERDSATLLFTRASLSPEQLEWLRELPARRVAFGSMLCCHGTPDRDHEYLLERVASGGVTLVSADDLAATLAGIRESVVLCGHSHVARTGHLPDGRLAVNPGSVGLPAYSDDLPWPHAMEAGSPHARYMVLEETTAGWRVEHVAVPYDWETAATTAQRNGRADWAEWLRTGRARVAGSGR